MFASASRAGGAHTSESVSMAGYSGARFYLDYTAGTGSTVVKIQAYNPTGDDWMDIAGATFAAVATAGTATLACHPALTSTINVSQGVLLGDTIRAIATITTNPATFSLGVDTLR
jgi:hypothetical protein